MSGGALFDQAFAALTGHPPFGWQRRLYEECFAQGEVPAALDIPTGLGKTAVMAVWLIALARQAESGGVRLPRRLVYVVDRRTVVDQATAVAEGLRRRLQAALDRPALGGEDDSVIGRWRPAERAAASGIAQALLGLCVARDDEASPLAISTLRGEFADNREWQADPARPTIIVGTVDMIGSRLLFSGYGVSRRMRPFHAGLIGQDTLIVHDEAHLSQPFGKLICELAARQVDRQAPRPLIISELSATQRKQDAMAEARFALTDAEKTEAEVDKRLRAVKQLRFEGDADSEDGALTKIVELALRYKDDRKRVLVYVRKPGDACAIAEKLTKATADSRVALLTGTVRGYERDALAATPLFKGFRSDPDRLPPEATDYLIATSAGEVGVDLDADHLVCDLSTLDSMIQRLGRVNRLGGREAEIHVVEWPKTERKGEGDGKLGDVIAATKAALAALPLRDGAHDASPESLRVLANRTEAFAPTPRTVPLTDILLDNWSLTRVKDLPGRPLPERWLHGVEGGEPDLYVAWREEVNDLAAYVAGDKTHDKKASLRIVKQFYDKHSILARERLRGPLRDVQEELKSLAKRKPKVGDSKQDESEEGKPPQAIQAIILPVNGDPIVGALSDLLERKAALPNATIVLPPSAGGLDPRGMLAGDARSDPERTPPYDVADEWDADAKNERRRLRVLLERKEGQGWSARILGRAIHIPDDLTEQLAAERTNKVPNRLLSDFFARTQALAQRALLVIEEDDEGPSKALQLLGASRAAATAQDDPAAAALPQDLDEHLNWAGDEAEKIIGRIGLKAASPDIAEAVVIAARWHDRGKNRPAWQRAIGNPPPRRGEARMWKPWAKSGQRGFDETACRSYRHEFGSLREASEDPTIRSHPERDLILHLIAAHHGWARPHFEPDQWDIADGVTEEENAAVAAETMRRFARLQCRFGHWGLAWLESLVRAADYAASGRLAANGASASPAPRAPANAAAKESAA
jgi:CRISPR-associated endonuclease/helicase Cas3